ncbi:GNAT family N-acetyltransferase [Nocardioides sp. TRM66260-LWL]|uniref:GNAT family N-acetyltransferase n=1 Tax=Nocardioides sp. TRM66260-LWL TaxID=2874478 RepID=UPI001CC67883|nr:GNAT family N-acetyltransferase [Nocardioides sp. TRM66260-LWL]MBZ5733201.1 GNAT family N-acetyltransferase [Nocardioides sp. TRM66260-LWL]
MLWRVRTSLPDRPGALAALARQSAEEGVDIRGVQVFPGVEAVTDELVLETAEGWTVEALRGLVERAGWTLLTAQPCDEAALLDQPTRYVRAARAILAQPASFPEVVAGLFDAEAEPADPDAAPQDLLEMTVGEVQVQVRRSVPFTDTERERGAAMAGLVSDVLQRTAAAGLGAAAIATPTARRMGTGAVPEHLVDGPSVSAVIDGAVVGLATVEPEEAEPGVRPVTLRVDPAWQRRGIGTRLLMDAARLATGLGASEILLTTRADNQAVLPMVLAAGMRGRIRMAADQLTVRVPVADLRPL